MRRVPATVITGFLGAGKTSLVRHLLAHAEGRRLAIIVNEFGELGIDRELLLGCGDAACSDEDIVELANGCLCCTVADDFVPTLTRLLDRDTPPEHILIETSGLALPKPLVQAFALARDPHPHDRRWRADGGRRSGGCRRTVRGRP